MMWMMMCGDFAFHVRAVYVGGTASIASRVRQGAYSNREVFSLGLRSGLGRYARGGGNTRREAGHRTIAPTQRRLRLSPLP